MAPSTATATCPWPVIVVVRSVPHIVSTVSGMMVPSWLRGPRANPGGCEQMVLAHEPQHAAFRCAKARDAQPGPDLAVTLAVKGAGGQDGADRVDQGRIRHRPDWTRTPWQLGPGGEMAIDRGARGAPDPAHAGPALGPAA